MVIVVSDRVKVDVDVLLYMKSEALVRDKECGESSGSPLSLHFDNS